MNNIHALGTFKLNVEILLSTALSTCLKSKSRNMTEFRYCQFTRQVAARSVSRTLMQQALTWYKR